MAVEGWMLSAPFALLCFFAWALALVVFDAAPRRPSNGFFALFLFVDGAAFGWSSLAGFVGSADVEYGVSLASNLVWTALPWVYLAFIAVALDTPWTRPLRSRTALVAMLVAAGASAASVVLVPHLYVTRVYSSPELPIEWNYDTGPLGVAFTFFLALVSLFGLVASISAFRRARAGSEARRRARAYVAGFAVRDALSVVMFLLFPLVAIVQGRDPNDIPLAAYFALVGAATIGLWASYVFLALGILRGELLGIAVKLKWTIRRGTVVAIFLGVFFIVAQVAQAFLTDALGWAVGGIVAGLLLFGLAPLQRLAEGVASAAMPGVKPARDMSSDERIAFYREQLRLAWADGSLSLDERRLLDHTRETLGIAPDEALRAEREVTGRVGSL